MTVGDLEEGTAANLVGRFGARSRVREAEETVRSRVDTRALHFFDPETGLGIYDRTPKERSIHMRGRVER